MGGKFVPLGCHSSYSLLWGTASVEALCEHAQEADVSTLALTDRNGLYGVLPFWEAARRIRARSSRNTSTTSSPSRTSSAVPTARSDPGPALRPGQFKPAHRGRHANRSSLRLAG